MDFHRITLLLSKHSLQLLLAKVIFRQYLEILSLSVCNFYVFLCSLILVIFDFLRLPLVLSFAVELFLTNFNGPNT